MTISRRSLVTAAIFLSVFGLPSVGHASADAARAFITQLGKETVDTLQNKGDPAKRAAQMEDILRRGFDFNAIGRFVLGRHWNTATPQQREEFLKAFTDFVSKSYSRRLAEEATINGFNITNMRDLGEGDFLVQTAITRPTGAPLSYEWRVRTAQGNTKIVDVIVEGVSLLITQRSDFSSVIGQSGLDGLIKSLKDKAMAAR
jgi:phospholipid transport system substrate-binding protein